MGFESVFLHSPDKGFWAYPGDLPPIVIVACTDVRPETRFVCSKHGSAILGSDSPQSNNI